MHSPSSECFNDLYELGDKLGAGAFATVIEGKDKATDKIYAIKIFDKSKLSSVDREALNEEINVLESLHHEHIIRLYHIYDEPEKYFLVTELVNGGELFDRIVEKKHYTEKEARDACKILLGAVAFCHSKDIAHRDLKPENLLLLNKESDSAMKIADFGFAKRVPKNGKLLTPCGTPRYVAPEIFAGGGHDTKVDMWSIGVIIYILLAGYAPFGGKPKQVLFERILRGEFSFHKQYWSNISKDAKNLIKFLLQVHPSRRLSAEDALKHSWMTCDDEAISDKVMDLERLKAFQANKKFRAAAHVVNAMYKFHGSSLINIKKNSLNIPQDLKKEDLNASLAFEPTQSFVECFVMGDKLGKGSFATVKQCVRIKNDEKYAVKIIEKSRLTPEDEEAVFDEVDILKSLLHPKILGLHYVFNEPDAIFLVTDLVLGGELFNRIVQKTNYTEMEARDTCKIILEAISFCHSKNVAHRDLKPENLLLASLESDCELKIADFGFAKLVNPHKPNCLATQCGTPEYVAPEVIAGVRYGVKVDMWSVGVISYILLSGYLPFHGSTVQKMFRRIVKGQYVFHDEYWGATSEDAKDFVRSLLDLKASRRLSAEDALKHKWITESDEVTLSMINLGETVKNLKKFNATRKFRAAANAVKSICALQIKLNSLGPIGTFKDMDIEE